MVYQTYRHLLGRHVECELDTDGEQNRQLTAVQWAAYLRHHHHFRVHGRQRALHASRGCKTNTSRDQLRAPRSITLSMPGPLIPIQGSFSMSLCVNMSIASFCMLCNTIHTPSFCVVPRSCNRHNETSVLVLGKDTASMALPEGAILTSGCLRLRCFVAALRSVNGLFRQSPQSLHINPVYLPSLTTFCK